MLKKNDILEHRKIVLVTMILKAAINTVFPYLHTKDELYVFAICYLGFNIILIISMIREDSNQFKTSVSISIIFDNIYSIVVNHYLLTVLPNIIYLYHSGSLLYFLGARYVLKIKAIEYIVFVFMILFFMQSSWYNYNNAKEFDLTYFGQYLIGLIFMWYLIFKKGMKNG